MKVRAPRRRSLRRRARATTSMAHLRPEPNLGRRPCRQPAPRRDSAMTVCVRRHPASPLLSFARNSRMNPEGLRELRSHTGAVGPHTSHPRQSTNVARQIAGYATPEGFQRQGGARRRLDAEEPKTLQVEKLRAMLARTCSPCAPSPGVQPSTRRRMMRKSRFSEDQILGVLREQEARAGSKRVCGRHGINTTPF
jgi:hypothetical protein